VREKSNLSIMVKAARKEKGWTQEYLAERVGKSLRHISGIENDSKSPSFEVLFALVMELNLNPEKIFYPEIKADSPERDSLTRLLRRCSDGDIRVVAALVEAMLRESGR
jgi:transcriptional regulator with XRE-family HTH domain